MAGHDSGYKQLFSHPRMVRDLLVGFVDEEWVAALDFATLERVNGSYVSDDLREREDDLVWRVRWGPGWVYVYLLLEFQSTVDRYMAVRMLAYLALLYQDLIKGRQPGDDSLLPPVLPLVLYNGERRWNAAVELSELILPVPGGLAAYRPSLRYLLLDEGSVQSKAPAGSENLAAALFRLENSRGPQELRAVVRRLIEWLHAPEQQSLRRSFTVWLRRVLLPNRLRGLEFPELNELHEVDAMLAERVKEWTRQWRDEGMKEGRQVGLQEGLQEGRRVGLREGMQKGREQGLREGEALLLERQMIRRFGPLPDWARARLADAERAELDGWGERLLDASSLEEVFGTSTG